MEVHERLAALEGLLLEKRESRGKTCSIKIVMFVATFDVNTRGASA